MCFDYKDWCNKLKKTIPGCNCSHLVTLQHSSDNLFVPQNCLIRKDNCIRHYRFKYDRHLIVSVTVLCNHIEQLLLTYTFNSEGGLS